MDVDILNSQLLGLLQVPVGPRISKLPPLGTTFPFSGVQFYSLPTVGLRVPLKLLKAALAIARIPETISNYTIRVLLPEGLVSLKIRKSAMIKIAEVLRIENRHVSVALFKYILY